MSLKRWEKEVSKRGLSQVTLSQDTMQRDAVASARQALRKRLRDSDDMFDTSFPKEDLLDVSAKRLRTVAAALQVSLLRRGDAIHGGTEDFEAYREYLLGLERAQERTVESIAAAERHFSFWIGAYG